jgi:hypothetical protein
MGVSAVAIACSSDKTEAAYYPKLGQTVGAAKRRLKAQSSWWTRALNASLSVQLRVYLNRIQLETPMTWKPIAALLVAAIATPAFAAVTLHGGEWQTRVNDGPTHLVCLSGDRTFDAPTLSKMFAMEGVTCSPPKIASTINGASYDAICQVGGGKLTVNEVISTTGPDAYTTHSKSHFEGSMKMPDGDDTQTSRRLGPCKPGDLKSPF